MNVSLLLLSLCTLWDAVADALDSAWLNTRGVLSTKLFLKARQAIISFLLRTGGKARLVNCFWHANETLVNGSRTNVPYIVSGLYIA